MIVHDENRIKQVLLNLVSNAIKFTLLGHVLIKVKVENNTDTELANKNFQKIKIDVEDTGVGIDEKDQDKLFKLFGFVKDSHGVNTHGIGLGLVIS